MGNVIPFPPLVAAECVVRQHRAQVRYYEAMIDNGPPDVSKLSQLEAVTRLALYNYAPTSLEHWQGELQKAEIELAMLRADDTLMFKGKTYRAERGSTGAH